MIHSWQTAAGTPRRFFIAPAREESHGRPERRHSPHGQQMQCACWCAPRRFPARRVLCYRWDNDKRRRKGCARDRRRDSVTADAAAVAVPAAKTERAARLGVEAGWLWSGALLVL